MISICTFQLTEMVNLHFLSLMEALAECKSTVLSLLLPLWTPVLQAQNPQVLNLICKGAKINLFFTIHGYLQVQLPAHLQTRLETCLEGVLPTNSTANNAEGSHDQHLEGWLLRWLQKLQFKLGQIEIQSSTASQFYNV